MTHPILGDIFILSHLKLQIFCIVLVIDPDYGFFLKNVSVANVLFPEVFSFCLEALKL